LSARILGSKPRGLLLAAAGTAGAAAVCLVLAAFLPRLSAVQDNQRSLELLRGDARRIKTEFAAVVSALDRRRESLEAAAFPGQDAAIWDRLRNAPLDRATEGLGYYDREGRLRAWIGNALDLESLFQAPGGVFPPPGRRYWLLKSKASAYLVSVLPLSGGARLALFRLLAFAPPIKSPYLEEYQFLSPGLRPEGSIDYWDFHEDTSGFEKIFGRHRDEYIGEPRQRDEVPSLIFPLRPGPGQIVATVSLSAPSRRSVISGRRETWLLAAHLGFGLSLVLLLIFLAVRLFPSDKPRPGTAAAFALAVIALRVVVFSMSRLEAVRSLPVFSPASASFFSIAFLTRSPADILATALGILLIVLALVHLGRRAWLRAPLRAPFGPALVGGAVAAFGALSLALGLVRVVRALVLNANLNLLRFTLNPTLIVLLLSVFCGLLSFFLLAWLILRTAVLLRSGQVPVLAGLAAGSAAFGLFFARTGAPELALASGPAVLAGMAAFIPRTLHRARALTAGIALAALWVCVIFNVDTLRRDRMLLEGSLRNTVLSQDLWAGFFLEESLAELDRQSAALMSYFRAPEDPELAHKLWEKMVVAKFNWYSSLEILDPQAAVLSRFSLNVPKTFQPSASLTPGLDWQLSRTIVSSMGKEKEFLVALKDWYEGEVHVGRTILSVSLDYEMLPFLYSANPYFELLRARSLPSLHPFDFNLAVFNPQGRVIFNPDKVTAGLEPGLLARVEKSPSGVWSRWADTRADFRGFFFLSGQRVYGLLLPVKTPLTFAVEFLKLFFFGLAALGLPALLLAALFRRPSLERYFWSFSNRVYLALVAVAIIPLLLFALSTRSFFGRIFSEQFADEAEIHADFARNVMEDYFYLPQEDRRPAEAPPEDLVLWISSTIGSDVNLYRDGRLVFSSRAEFFDSGLLPELIDGETYYNLAVVRHPLATQLRTIGDYSFHTLTIPYTRPGALFLISLPFPFEQEDISNATAELVEFLLFLFAFVLALVAVFARNIRTMIVAPIRRLLDATQEAGRGNLDIQLEHKPNDEMKTLVEGFNAMVRNLKRHQRDLAEMGQKAAWAEMARKVAHEIKNPLTPIQLSAEHLLRVYSDRRGDFEQALKESTAYIISEVENLRKIAQEFLESSREAAPRREPVDMREILDEVLAPYRKMLSDRITFQESYDDGPPVCLGDKSRLKMAVRNLIINAIESIPGRGRISLTVARSGEELTLEIRDTGSGIRPDVLRRIFEPSFSTKPSGAGLGLPIAKKIVEDHGGSLHLSSRPGAGTRATIVLPCGTEGGQNPQSMTE
jgi:signal transduction histidine kinase